MNRALLAVVFALTFVGCDMKAPTRTLPLSHGMADEVIVVADDEIWEGPVGDALREVFAEAFPVTPQYEATIKVSQVPFSKLSDLLRNHRNLLILADLSVSSPTSDYVVESLGEEYTAKALLDPSFFYASQKDVWSQPQKIMVVFGNSQQQLIALINEKGHSLIGNIQRFDLEHKYMLALKSNKDDAEIEKGIKDTFGINMYVPNGFIVAQTMPNFEWIRRETDKISMHVFIHTVPLDSFPFESATGILLRNRYGSLVETHNETAYMISDSVLPYVVTERTIGGLPTIDTRGLWSMVNDFMGGSFMNYLIKDEANNRLIMLDGFIYAPGEKKKVQMRYLEAMFSTFEVAKKQ